MLPSKDLALTPANDNPPDSRQVEMFDHVPVYIGVDIATGKDFTVVASMGNGISIVHEIIERGDEPQTAEGRALFGPKVVA